MPIFSNQQIIEINSIIAEIEKTIESSSEIGARDKAFLTPLLKANDITKAPIFFKCKREYSDAIVSHFVKEKGLVKNRYHMNNQSFIYILK